MIKKMMLLLILLGFNYIWAGNIVFSIKPNDLVQNASIGYQMNNILIYGGMELGLISATIKETDYFNWGNYSEYESKRINASAVIFAPQLGLRFYTTNKHLNPYLYGEIFKAFTSVKGKSKIVKKYNNGYYSDTNTTVNELSDEQKKGLGDVLSPWGLNFGLGVDYPINNYFSIFGQYGFRMIYSSSTYSKSDDSSYYEDMDDELKAEFNGAFKFTTASLGISFNFK